MKLLSITLALILGAGISGTLVLTIGAFIAAL